MAQKKLFRFAQIKTFTNVQEYPENMQGNWQGFFKNKNSITLELACGRGEYTIGLAGLYPARNFIGVDIKGNRMYLGAKKALDLQLNNAAFLRTQIEMLPQYFAHSEVDEIWITFPDPQLRTSKAKKRLTHPRFLRLYQQILKPGGFIHLKTDSPDLYNFTRRVIDMYGCKVHLHSDDINADILHMPELQIRTHYESLDIAQSKKIHYLRFSLPLQMEENDDALKKLLKDEHSND
ncbi:MAG: tRNA (guanosine(46)-N7)-methyltransferase TrmB [Ferruginibacter sp.]